jgi:hypothetical protein
MRPTRRSRTYICHGPVGSEYRARRYGGFTRRSVFLHADDAADDVEVLFTLRAERYERRSMLITTWQECGRARRSTLRSRTASDRRRSSTLECSVGHRHPAGEHDFGHSLHGQARAHGDLLAPSLGNGPRSRADRIGWTVRPRESSVAAFHDRGLAGDLTVPTGVSKAVHPAKIAWRTRRLQRARIRVRQMEQHSVI